MAVITYDINEKNYYPESAEGMHVLYADRTDSYRATIQEMEYIHRHRPLHLYLMSLISVEPGRKYPVIVYCQGSGYRKQDVLRPLPQLAELVHKGYFVASVEYRHTDEGACFPSQVQDMRAAVRYIRLHADELHIDPDRIAFWGDSSGGHTIALAAVGDDPSFDDDAFKDISARAKCCVDFYGIAEIEGMKCTVTPELLKYFDGDPLQKLFGGPLDEHMDAVEKANVGKYIHAGKKVPPFLLIHGDEDEKVPFTQSLYLYKTLRENGHRAELYKVRGAGHGNRVWTKETMKVVEDFLRAYL